MSIATFIVAALMATQQPAGHTGGHGVLDSSSVRGSGATLAGTPEPDQELPQTRTGPNGERLICRRMESSVSRSSARRLCLTREEWRARAQN